MSALFSITIYLILNLLVTITNKSIISITSSPYFLTAFHATASYISARILHHYQQRHHNSNQSSSLITDHHRQRPQHHKFTTNQTLILLLFSLLYTINISISNLSLGLVSLPLHQTIRATAPALTLILQLSLSILLHNNHQPPWKSFKHHTAYSSQQHPSTHSKHEPQIRPLPRFTVRTTFPLLPIILGVLLATHSESHYTATPTGLILTFLGAVLAVVKTIATHEIQRSWKVSGVELIRVLAPLAVVQGLGFAWVRGEIGRGMSAVKEGGLEGDGHYHDHGGGGDSSGNMRLVELPGSLWVVMLVIGNAGLAAALNISSFDANRRCGPLSMAVAANVKQVCVLIWEMRFGSSDVGQSGGTGEREVSWQVVFGSLITVAGGIWHAFAQAVQRNREKSDKSETDERGRRRERIGDDAKRNDEISPCQKLAV